MEQIIALVTGASRGAGRAIAACLGERGAIVYVTGRSTRAGTRTEDLPGTVDDTADEVGRRGGQGIAVRCDHRDDAQVAALFERIAREQAGRLDLLVNNAWPGYEHYDPASFAAPFWAQPLERWPIMFDGGVRPALVAAQHAARLMRARRRGLIINVTAADAHGRYVGAMIYDLAKNAMARMALGMGEELEKDGVAAVALAPGFMRTERVLAAAPPEALAQTESPEYVGRAVAALATDPQVMRHTGKLLTAGGLARVYDFRDVDGRQPAAFEMPPR